MARTFARTFRGRTRQVRESLWIPLDTVETTLAAASTATLVASLNAAALALRPFTIVRTRGFWGLRSDQVAATENFSASQGHCIVSDQASAIGITAVPTPETDRGSDLWYLHESFAGSFNFDVDGSMRRGIWGTYDSKAMRKVNNDQDLVIVVETSSISSGAIVHQSGRILVKLH